MASEPSKPGPSKPNADKPVSGKGGPTPKQLAAQARAEAEAAERRRERMIRGIGAVVVLLVVAGLLVLGFTLGQQKDEEAAGPEPDASAPSPAGVSSDNYGVPYGAGWAAEDAAKLPTLELWEDFQCPACGALEEAAGADIQQVANEGLVKLLYRPTTFLDNSFPQSQNASARATAAWGCAVDAGKTGEYHSGIFAMQPDVEGTGYTDEQLKSLGGQVGIEGEALDTFGKCFDEGRYLPWSANSYQKFLDGGVSSTPTALINGVEVENSDIADPEKLRSLIADATAK